MGVAYTAVVGAPRKPLGLPRYVGPPRRAAAPPRLRAHGPRGAGQDGVTRFILAGCASHRESARTALAGGQQASRLCVINGETGAADALSHGRTPSPDVLVGLSRTLERSAAKTMAVDSCDRALPHSLVALCRGELQ